MDLFCDTIQWYYICVVLLPFTVLVWSILSKSGKLIFAHFCFQLTFHKFGQTRNHQDNQLPNHHKMGRYHCNCFIQFSINFYLLDARLVVANRNVQVDCFDIQSYHNNWKGKILWMKEREGKLRFKELTYMVCHSLMKFICIIYLLAKHDLFFKLITWYCEILESFLVGN